VVDGVGVQAPVLRAVLVLLLAGVVALVMLGCALWAVLRDRGRTRAGAGCLVGAVAVVITSLLVIGRDTMTPTQTHQAAAMVIAVVCTITVLVGCLLILLPQSLGE